MFSRARESRIPISRITALVDTDSSQMIGRKSELIRSIGAATASDMPSTLRRARRLGTNSPTTRVK
ncbi:unannotated protein [freshwater metagenome]|uniref:Unannotated protein n=1 Tax=freshwater metagenome TaxID=449393 RepID=A0A6J7IYF9_9ZZZZ